MNRISARGTVDLESIAVSARANGRINECGDPAAAIEENPAGPNAVISCMSFPNDYANGNAWQIQGTRAYSCNHVGAVGHRETFPIGVGATEAVHRITTPWHCGLKDGQDVGSPAAFGQHIQIRFTETPAVSLPW